MSSRLERIYEKAKNSGVLNKKRADSVKWFKEYVRKNIKQINSLQNVGGKLDSTPDIGALYYFEYDAKYKDTLPYWDAVPLIIFISYDSEYMYGINLHYIPPILRVKIIDAITAAPINAQTNTSTFNVLNNMSKHKYVKHAYKRYLRSNVIGNMYRVDETHWDIAIFLPLAKFKSAKGPISKQRIYNDGRGN